MLAVPGLIRKISLVPATCFHHSFNTFAMRTENINSVLEEQKHRVSAMQTSDGGRPP